MKRLVVFACAALMGICAGLSPLHAQEAVVAQPTSGAAGMKLEAYERKIQDLTRIIKIMEEQINKCAADEGLICPSVLAQRDRSVVRHTVEEAPQKEDVQEEEDVSTSGAPSSQPYTPPAASRYGTGFRMAPEQRLTCGDYSDSYFQRHPTMAKVCGRGEEKPAVEAPVVPVRAPVSPSLVPSSVSATPAL